MDSSYPHSQDPEKFRNWLFGRLRDIAYITWDESTPPTHSSYGDWHVWGTFLNPESSPTSRTPGSPGQRQNSFGSRPSTPSRTSSDGKHEPYTAEQQILARISCHTLTLERQYQLATTHAAISDPFGKHHVRALQLFRLPGHNHELSLAVIMYERPGPNYLRDLINCGPSWYKATQQSVQSGWRPGLTASGDFDAGKTKLSTFLSFAVGAAKCCEILHQGDRLVHGELRGDSFHYNEETREVKLLNLGSGVRSFEHYLTSSGWTALTRQAGVDYKLEFIAPEQTGRVQSSPDSRSDLYSLGLLFWNMLTGDLPFSGSNPLEIIRNSLSRRVPPVSSKRLDVPDALSAVIEKLVSKNIEDRYHSANGLQWDLEKIQSLLSEGDSEGLKLFQIGSKDVSSFWSLPDLQLNREHDRERVLAIIDRVSKGKHTHVPVSKLSNLIRSDSSASDGRPENGVHLGETNSDSASIQSRISPVPSSSLNDSTAIRPDRPGSAANSYSGEREDGEPSGLLQHSLQKRISTDYTPSVGSNEMAGSSLYSVPEGPDTILKGSSKFKRKGKTDIVAVCGPPGMGKSSLLHSIHSEARAKGYLAIAKFDQCRNAPYEPVLKLLSSVMRQIFSESEICTQFHQNLRSYIRPAFGILSGLLGLPESLLDVAKCPNSASQSSSIQMRLPTEAQAKTSGTHNSQSCAAYTSSDFLRNGASTSKNIRLMAIYLDVLRFIATQRFVVFCLEDAHFADEESLSLIQAIIGARIELVIAMSLKEHDHSRTSALLRQKPSNVTIVNLKPLSEDDIAEYVSATMRRSKEYTFPLVAVIHEKTGGNPFFMREMLDNCYRTNCVYYSWKDSRWTFNLDKIFAEFASESYGSQISDDHLVRRLMDLPEGIQKLLAWASLIGNTWRFSMIKALLRVQNLSSTNHETMESSSAQNSHVNRPLSHSGKVTFMRQSSQDAVRALQGAVTACIVEADEADDLFRFCHDRYQHGAMKLCTDVEEMQFQISQLMVEGARGQENPVYVRAAHICASIQVVRKRVHNRRAYRETLFQAGERAIESGGSAAGLEYFSNAITLLQDDPWNEALPDVSYRETLILHNKAADSYAYSGCKRRAMDLLETIIQQAKIPLDKVPAYIMQSRLIAKMGDVLDSLKVLKICLRELGLNFYETSWEECDDKFHELCHEFTTSEDNQLLNRPNNDDEITNALCAVLIEATAAAFWTSSLLYYHFALVEMQIHTRKGNIPQSGLILVHFATLVVGRFDLHGLANNLAQTADKYFEKYSSNAYFVGRGQALSALMLGHLQMPMADFLPRMEYALDMSLSAGDKFAALLNLGVTASMRIWCSHDMNEVENFSAFAAEEIPHWQNDIRGGVYLLAVRQYTRALQGKTKYSVPSEIFNDEDHNSENYTSHIKEISKRPQRSLSTYQYWRLQALVIFGHYSEAIELGEEMVKHVEEYWSLRFVIAIPFYLSLAYMAAFRREPERYERAEVITKISNWQQRLLSWSQACEANYGVWAHMITAGLRGLEGRFDLSMRAYEQALDLAEIMSMHLEFALTSEWFAENMLRKGAKRPAKHCILDAIAAYRKFSAFGKADQLAAKHEYLLRGTSSLNSVDVGCQVAIVSEPKLHDGLNGNAEDSDGPVHAVRSHETEHQSSPRQNDDPVEIAPESVGLDILDLTSILKSSQVLSSELQVDKLLSKMTHIILDSTSADLCAILVDDEDIGMNVGSIVDSNGTEYPAGEPLDNVDDVVGKQIVINCMRFKEIVFLHNVLEDERFSNVPESYRTRHPDGRAIIAMPILHGDHNILGSVYLEGPPHSFTERNTMVLRLLVNSITISITNAMLFKKAEKASANNAVMVEAQKVAVSQARQAEKKAKVATEEAMRNVQLMKEAEKSKSMFLANVSHELRTPLNGVIGMSELLKGSKLTPEQDGYADSIRVCADTLLTVINDILDFSKLEAGKMQMFSVPLSLHETIQEVVRALSYSNLEKHLETKVDLNLPKDLILYGDPVRIHQILMNLMSNAYKFTRQGSVKVRADVDHEDETEIQITCSVSDTGVGISEEQKKKLFLPFSQADSSTARSFGGTGLGLSICKAIIEGVMKGKIWLDSSPGAGTTVSFTLKFVKAPQSSDSQKKGTKALENDPMAIYSPSSEAHTKSPLDHTDITKVSRDQIRVCIAEDNLINQKIALSFVRKIGFKCEAFPDGRQAVDALTKASAAKDPFHVVLMDVQMPILDGYNATREIRKHQDPMVKNVLVIAMTASAIRGDRTKCLEAGMNNYLAKPVRQQVLREMLEGYVEKNPASIPAVDRDLPSHEATDIAKKATQNGLAKVIPVTNSTNGDGAP